MELAVEGRTGGDPCRVVELAVEVEVPGVGEGIVLRIGGACAGEGDRTALTAGVGSAGIRNRMDEDDKGRAVVDHRLRLGREVLHRREGGVDGGEGVVDQPATGGRARRRDEDVEAGKEGGDVRILESRRPQALLLRRGEAGREESIAHRADLRAVIDDVGQTRGSEAGLVVHQPLTGIAEEPHEEVGVSLQGARLEDGEGVIRGPLGPLQLFEAAAQGRHHRCLLRHRVGQGDLGQVDRIAGEGGKWIAARNRGKEGGLGRQLPVQGRHVDGGENGKGRIRRIVREVLIVARLGRREPLDNLAADVDHAVVVVGGNTGDRPEDADPHAHPVATRRRPGDGDRGRGVGEVRPPSRGRLPLGGGGLRARLDGGDVDGDPHRGAYLNPITEDIGSVKDAVLVLVQDQVVEARGEGREPDRLVKEAAADSGTHHGVAATSGDIADRPAPNHRPGRHHTGVTLREDDHEARRFGVHIPGDADDLVGAKKRLEPKGAVRAEDRVGRGRGGD